MANNTLLASDNWVSGALAAGWTNIFSMLKSQVVAGSPNVTEPNATNTVASQYWSGLVWPKDHSSEITINALTNENSTLAILYVRIQAGANSGYQCNIGIQTLSVFKVTAGATVQLRSTISGLTIGAGDVWTFQAAGSALTVYQNGTPRFSANDATWTSGSPGFGQYTTVNITHNKIASWRGYSAIQQDGIWNKRGTILPALAAEISVTNGSGTQNPSVIYEGNAQILSGNVFKMWFSAGGNPVTLAYAESTDGLAWSRYSGNPVIANVGATAPVLKNGSTYYCYGSGINANVTLFTSADGITWASQGTVFSRVGHIVTYFAPIAITGGIWYALYIDLDAPFAYPLHTRLATSSDGVIWVDYGSNPVVDNFFSVTTAYQIGSTWYCWGSDVNPNAQEVTKPSIDPGEGKRMQTTDFIHWTNPVRSAHHSQMFENVNGVNGGCYVNFPVNVNGIAYLYYTAAFDDLILYANPLYQISVATGPAAISSIVLGQEDGIQRLGVDTFTGGAGTLGANWTTPASMTALQVIAGNLVEATATNVLCGAFYNAAIFSTTQYSEVTIAALTGGANVNFAEPAVYFQNTALVNCYHASIGSPTGSLKTVSIYKNVAGVDTQLGPSIPCTLANSDVIRLAVAPGSDGSNVLSLFQNGYMIGQVQDYAASLTTGSPGMIIFVATAQALTTAQVSRWAGGNAGVISSGSSSGGLLLRGVG